MTVDADKKGISSTSDNDTRILPIGQKIRKYKRKRNLLRKNLLRKNFLKKLNNTFNW